MPADTRGATRHPRPVERYSTTPDPHPVAWVRSEFDRITPSPDARRLARRFCGTNTLGVTPDDVLSEALRRMWANPPSPESLYDEAGWVRSQFRHAYLGLIERALVGRRRIWGRPIDPSTAAIARRPRRAVDIDDLADPDDNTEVDDPVGFGPHVQMDLTWIVECRDRVRCRLGELGPNDHAEAQALAALMALLAIAANGGALPATAPERSERLEAVEREWCAAAWLADPKLRAVGDGPDSASIRQRRRRLAERTRRAAAELIPTEVQCWEVAA